MDIVTVRSDSLICSLCGKDIPVGAECLKFFSRGRKKGVLHHRHFECQYEIKERKESLLTYIEDIRTQSNNRKVKRQQIKILSEKFEKNIVRCPDCLKPFLSTHAMEQHRKDRHSSEKEKTGVLVYG